MVCNLAPEREQLGSVTVERIHLATEPGIVVPVLLLLPAVQGKRVPVVVAVAQEGKQEFLRQRAGPIADLLAGGIAVCLPDVRGTGETAPGESRGRTSAATSISASELMRGQSVLGGRLRDLRSVLRHLRQRPDVDGRRFALWGESFAPVNPADRELNVPHNAAQRPAQSEPLGGLLALLGALFEADARAVYVRGGLSDYQSALAGPFCYLPHDVVVPEVLTRGDLPELAAALAPVPSAWRRWSTGSTARSRQKFSAEGMSQRGRRMPARPIDSTSATEKCRERPARSWLKMHLAEK